MKIKYKLKITILFVTLVMAGISTTDAFPGETEACNGPSGCHAPNTSINITSDVTSTLTVHSNQTFMINTSWSGGSATRQTVAKWPTDFTNIGIIRNNSLFNPTPVMSTAAISPSGILSSILTAPNATGNYIVRVYASTANPLITNFQDVNITVEEPVVVSPTITILPSTAALNVNGTQVFNATALDQNNTPMAGVNISWTVSNSNVGNVTPLFAETGLDGIASTTFTALAPGNTTINAANGTISGSANVIVTTVPPVAGSISGMKFEDQNNNSMKDPGESGLSGWTIVLTLPGGSTISTTTDANGNYTFSNLTSGNYTVAEILQPSWIQTSPTNGTYAVTITDEENLTGIDFGNNLPVTPPTNVTVAIRTIEKESLRLGESTNVTVNISSIRNQALSLREIVPAGWNLTRVSDGADAYKSSTNEWIWFNATPGINKTVTYRLTAPSNVSIGTYHINGTISSASGVIAVVQGDNTITLDIIAYYTRLGNDFNRLETEDVLAAVEDWRSNTVPAGFERAILTQELLALIDEWVVS